MPSGIYKHKKCSETTKEKIRAKRIERKNKFGYINSPETRKKMANEKHPLWKGDEACYSSMHKWIIRHKGNAKEHKCEHCGKQAHDWANKKHDYKHNLDDYMALCRSCHHKFDVKYNKKK